MKKIKTSKIIIWLIFALVIGAELVVIRMIYSRESKTAFIERWDSGYVSVEQESGAPRPKAEEEKLLSKLVDAAIASTNLYVRYDPSYVKIKYPGGDVPEDQGVCSDVIIRSYRHLGIDLQKEVHEDMERNFRLYPKIWGLGSPDTNIDHRRVPNLMVFFKRKGKLLSITDNPNDFSPGDIVTWDLGGGLTHIGLVINRKSVGSNRFQVVHNIGAGPKAEDVLFNWKVTGHFRYFGNE